jgi:predicted nucleotidyltransferase
MKSIVFKTIGIKGLLKNIFEKIKGVEVAFIYGSFAKNEENAKSDIDLFVIGKVDEDKLVAETGKLEKVLKREINYSLYSKVDFIKKKREKDPFISDLLEDSKIFLVGDKNDF